MLMGRREVEDAETEVDVGERGAVEDAETEVKDAGERGEVDDADGTRRGGRC